MGTVVVDSVSIVSTNMSRIVVVAIVIVVNVDYIVILVRSGVSFAVMIFSVVVIYVLGMKANFVRCIIDMAAICVIRISVGIGEVCSFEETIVSMKLLEM